MIWLLRKEVNSLSLKIVLEKSILGHRNLACAWVLIYHTHQKENSSQNTYWIHKLVEFLNENCGIPQKKETERNIQKGYLFRAETTVILNCTRKSQGSEKNWIKAPLWGVNMERDHLLPSSATLRAGCYSMASGICSHWCCSPDTEPVYSEGQGNAEGLNQRHIQDEIKIISEECQKSGRNLEAHLIVEE